MVVLRDGHGEVRALAPFGEPLVERVAVGLDRVAQRLEHRPQERLAAPHRQHVEPGLERDRRRRQLGPVLAAALEGRAEDLGDRHAQERRGDVGPVVDVLREQEPWPAPLPRTMPTGSTSSSRQARAAVVGRLGVEDVALPKLRS